MNPNDGLAPKSATTTAFQTLASLRARWGSNVPPGVPLSIDVAGMSTEHWLLSGPPAGEASRYVLEREWPGQFPGAGVES